MARKRHGIFEWFRDITFQTAASRRSVFTLARHPVIFTEVDRDRRSDIGVAHDSGLCRCILWPHFLYNAVIRAASNGALVARKALLFLLILLATRLCARDQLQAGTEFVSILNRALAKSRKFIPSPFVSGWVDWLYASVAGWVVTSFADVGPIS